MMTPNQIVKTIRNEDLFYARSIDGHVYMTRACVYSYSKSGGMVLLNNNSMIPSEDVYLNMSALKRGCKKKGQYVDPKF